MLSPFKSESFRVTSPYGNRTSPITGAPEFHGGIDLVCDASDNIISVSDGVVITSTIITDHNNVSWQWGNYVKVLGADGVSVFYCHMARRMAVQGQRVSVGDLIGIEGATGQVTGKHLHFECRRGVTKISAAEYIGIPNTVGTYTVPVVPAIQVITEYDKLVADKCGLEAQTLDYINKYRFAKDFWHKIWLKIK